MNLVLTHILFSFGQCQRRQFKLYSEGKDSNMTKERIQKLKQLGFVFTPRKPKESVIFAL
jgi:hypothetical protein